MTEWGDGTGRAKLFDDMVKKILIISICFFIIAALLIGQRVFYGTWNPFETPVSIVMTCYGRIYKASRNPPAIFSDKETPAYSICAANTLFGKRTYSLFPKGESVPTVIFLKLEGNKYQEYELSGGP